MKLSSSISRVVATKSKDNYVDRPDLWVMLNLAVYTSKASYRLRLRKNRIEANTCSSSLRHCTIRMMHRVKCTLSRSSPPHSPTTLTLDESWGWFADRQFRQSLFSPRNISSRLPEPTGINDASAPSPRLYDIESGDRVYLEPSTPSGRTLLAGLEPSSSSVTPSSVGGLGAADDAASSSSYHSERPQPSTRPRSEHPSTSKDRLSRRLARADGRSCQHHRRHRLRDGAFGTRFHEQASPRSPPLARTTAPRSRSLARRSASAGDVRRGGLYATTTRGDEAAVGAPPPSPEQALREPDRSEATKRRRDAEQHSKATAAAATARQLACRLLCRGRRTRLLVAALWRWRCHAARLGREQARKDEKERENKQVMGGVRFRGMGASSSTGFWPVFTTLHQLR